MDVKVGRKILLWGGSSAENVLIDMEQNWRNSVFGLGRHGQGCHITSKVSMSVTEKGST